MKSKAVLGIVAAAFAVGLVAAGPVDVLVRGAFRGERFEVWDAKGKVVEFELATEVRALKAEVSQLKALLSQPAPPTSAGGAASSAASPGDETISLLRSRIRLYNSMGGDIRIEQNRGPDLMDRRKIRELTDKQVDARKDILELIDKVPASHAGRVFFERLTNTKVLGWPTVLEYVYSGAAISDGDKHQFEEIGIEVHRVDQSGRPVK